MTKNWTRKTIGDVIAVSLATSVRYLQYIGQAGGMEIFRVIAAETDGRDISLEELAQKESLFYLCSYCSVLRADSRFSYFGRTTPVEPMPVFRKWVAGPGWAIYEDEREKHLVSNLDDETSRLSILEALSAEDVVERLRSNWCPADSRDDFVQAMSKFHRERENARMQTFVYASFPSAVNATKALEELAKSGELRVERESSGLRVAKTWQSRDAIDLDAMEAQVERVVSKFGGVVSGRDTGPV